MNDSTQKPAGSSADQRDALAQSERQATESEPANFRDQANAEKIVEIPPVDGEAGKPIRGIDPKK